MASCLLDLAIDVRCIPLVKIRNLEAIHTNRIKHQHREGLPQTSLKRFPVQVTVANLRKQMLQLHGDPLGPGNDVTVYELARLNSVARGDGAGKLLHGQNRVWRNRDQVDRAGGTTSNLLVASL